MKKLFVYFLLLASISLWAMQASAQTGKNLIQKHILDNGMTVLIKEMPTSPVVAIYALVKTGSATEGKYLGRGISHFVEHMLFKGTDRRAVGQVSQEIMNMGGHINASTGLDHTIYTIELPAGSFEKGLDIIADVLMNSKFDAEETEKERKVIFGEMRLYKDNPDRRLSELVFDQAYLRHPYKYPIIGYESLFAGITRDQLYDYFKTTYIPNNIVLSVAGSVDAGQILPKIQEAFKDYPRGPYLSRNLPLEPEQIAAREYQEEYPTELTRLSMAFGGVSLLDRDMCALDVLGMILGQGASSRLYLDVYKKKGLVHSIMASNYTPMDRGLFEISALLDGSNLEGAIKSVWENINNIKQNGVTEKELAKVKRQAISRHVFENQSAGDVADDMAINEMMAGDPDFESKYVEAIGRVSLDDVKRVANQYLNPQKLTVVVLKPLSDKSVESLPEEKNKPNAIKKITLDNGMIVLLREDHTFPLVNVTLALQGGIRQETWEKNGVSELIARLWDKGTKTRSAQDIAKAAESLGASLGGFSGRNSFGLQLNILAQDFNTGFDLMEDVIKNPVFSQEEFFKEKEQMKAGIVAREDNIFDVTGRALRETLFLTHPSRLDKLGRLDSIDQISRQDVIDQFGKFSHPNNMVLSVFGDINSEEVLNSIKMKFNSLAKGPVNLASSTEDPPQETREKNLTMDKEQAMVMIGFQGAKINDEERFGLEVMTSLLGSSFNGRIFNKIREQLGKAYTLGGNFTPGVDPGLIYFYVLTSDDQVDKVKDTLLEQIREIQSDPIPDEEFSNMQTYLKGSFKMSLETNAAQGMMCALDELYGLGYDNYEQYEAKIDQVAKSDIQRLAQKYLDLKKAAIVITRPLKH